jgi:competence protein ComER
MGGMLVDAFIRSGALSPDRIAVANRTHAKAERLALRHPGLAAVRSNAEAAAGRDIVFLCVKPLDYKTVIDEIRASVQPEQLIVSITSPVLLALLEEWLPCRVAKVIPSITNMALGGVTLCIYGSRVEPGQMAMLEGLLSHISRPVRIDERHTRIASDLSSCGPAFMAFILQRFVEAAAEETGIGRDEAERLAAGMLLGTGRLLADEGLSAEELIRRVSVPGGITAAALKQLDAELDGVFNRLIRTTHKKFREDLAKVDQSFAVKH